MNSNFPMARRGRLPLVAVVAVLMVLVSACSPVTPAESARARAAVTGEAGDFRFQLPEQPSGFNPFAFPGTSDALLAAAQFQPLIAVVNGRVMPRFADWWGTNNEDRTTLVRVRDGSWSDGTRFTARDVIFTIEEHLKPANNSPLVPTLLGIEGAEEFRAGRAPHVAGLYADTSRSVVINLVDADPAFLSKLTNLTVLPQTAYAGQDLSDDAVFHAPEVGSGAYVFSAWEDPETVVLLPNPEMENPPRMSRMVATHIAPAEVVSQLEPGGLDLASVVPLRDIEKIPAGFRVLQNPGNSVVGITGVHGGLADVRIRQAMELAIDREAILAEELGGLGRVPDSVMFSPDWVSTSDTGAPAADPEAARSLVAEVGQPGAEPLNLVVLTADSDPTVWNRVAGQLAAVGIPTTVSVRSPTERAEVLADPTVHAIVDTWVMPSPEPSLVGPWVACGTAPGGYCNASLDELMAEADRTRDPLERQKLYQQANQILIEEDPIIPLWVPDMALVLDDERGGVTPTVEPVTCLIDFWGPA